MHPSASSCISDALDELAAVEPGLAEIVDLKFFCGFSFAEIAAMRDVSERTIQRGWEKAPPLPAPRRRPREPPPAPCAPCRPISPERWRVAQPVPG